MDAGHSYTQIASISGLGKPNVAKLCQQEKMRRGETLGHIDPLTVRKRYIADAVDIKIMATEMGCSVSQTRLFIQAHKIFRDRGAIYRAGTKAKTGKGVRKEGSLRDLARFKARKGSPEHREKLAVAKRGRRGENANHWKGGTYLSGGAGYEMITVNGEKLYAHRHIAECAMKRRLKKDEQVHHRNMDRLNNLPENLIVVKAQVHSILHAAMKRRPSLDQTAWLVNKKFWHVEVHNA
jgi:hypothetical protein